MKPTTPTAYPLAWPSGWPRSVFQEHARFKTDLRGALNNLRRQIELMDGKGLILSSNCALGHEKPKDPGVCAYFTLRQQNLAIPCDRWCGVESNVQAIALTVEAMRGMERWGAKHMITAMFSGFRALPEKTSGINPWYILGVDPVATPDTITAAFRRLSKIVHPDIPGTGSAEKWRELREAHDLAQISARGRK